MDRGIMRNVSTPLSQAVQLVLADNRPEAVQLLRDHLSIHPRDQVIAGVLTRLLKASDAMLPDPQTFTTEAVISNDDLQFLQQQVPDEPEFDFFDPEVTRTEAEPHESPGAQPIAAKPAEAVRGPSLTQDQAELEVTHDHDIKLVHDDGEAFTSSSQSIESLLEDPENPSLDSVDPTHERAWEEFALGDGYEPESDHTANDVESAAIRLSHRQRAEQVAAEIASTAGWDRRECEVLIDILAYRKSHWKTRDALKDLINEKEATADELRVAHEWRQLWAESPYCRCFRLTHATEGWPSCPWKLTLRLIRELAVDDAEQILPFVDDCFADWSDTPGLVNAYPYFAGYLDRVMTVMEDRHVNGRRAMPAFIDYTLFADDDDEYNGWRINHTRFPFDYSVVEAMY